MDKSSIKQVAILILIIVSIYAFFTYGLKIIFNTDVPIAVVESGSMKPTLNIGDIIIAKGVNPKELKVGDIIIFQLRNSNVLIVHRIVNIINKGDSVIIYTKGDNNPVQDPWFVTGDEVKGLVIFRIPFLGYISLIFQKTPQLYLAFIILILIILFIPQTRKK